MSRLPVGMNRDMRGTRRSRVGEAIVAVALGAAALGASAGCAPVPRPAVLGQVAAVRAGAAAEESRAYAAAAYAKAEGLRQQAESAQEAGDPAAAQLLGERALAAYAGAHALARIARAEAAETDGAAELAAAKAELATLTAEQTRVAAELDATELNLRVTRDAQPVLASGKADPAREKARLSAARALALQARMLCGAAHLLMASSAESSSEAKGHPAAGDAELRTSLDAATAAVQELDAELSGASAAPIDRASRVRADCLGALTRVRRAATPVTRAPGSGDALLGALSAAGKWSPSRDDRGVVVALRDVFTGRALSPSGKERLAELGRIAAAHPGFPVAVVVHADREPVGADVALHRARADAAVAELRGADARRVDAVLAGARAPVVDPAGRDRAQNSRLEIVFVTPETL